jgi:hypothetical protein
MFPPFWFLLTLSLVFIFALSLKELRDKRWFFPIWFPMVVLAVVGTAAFLYTVFSFGNVPPGPDGGFYGLGLVIGCICSLPFLFLLYLCIRYRPKRQAYTPFFVVPTVAILVVALVAPFVVLKRTVLFLAVDENGKPVADVIFDSVRRGSWSPFNGHERSRTSMSGLASVKAYKGQTLDMTVSKESYYTSRIQNRFAFGPKEISDAAQTGSQFVFHLRRKGAGGDLITSQYGVEDYLGVTVPLDGSPVRVNPLERKPGEGPLTISQSKPTYKSWKQAAEWSFRMEIPGGGFIAQSDEFPFEAPETGYEPVALFHFQKETTNWMTNLRKDYYIKFGNPPRYGRLHLETSISMSGARLTYAINPDGSRNLEPK